METDKGVNEILDEWKEQHDCECVEIDLNGKIKFLFDDDYIWSDSIERDNPEDMTGQEIISNLAMNMDELYKERNSAYKASDKLLNLVERERKALKLSQEIVLHLIEKFNAMIKEDNIFQTQLILMLKSVEDIRHNRNLNISLEDYKKIELLTEKEN